MNFARQFDKRFDDSEKLLLEATKRELDIVNEYGIDNTFLLQYDALIHPSYIELFKTCDSDHTEIGLWYEIVQPLCENAGIEWRGEAAWDWHVVPGFSMAYSIADREKLADVAMNDFKDIYGFYPKTVASWLIDTHSLSYMSEKYGVEAFAICRDQVNTDAYTLVGGYFNQGYFPSKYNCFTPAQTNENTIKTPVFRLLGPDPIHNYDNDKYLKNNKDKFGNVFTLEAAHPLANNREYMDWFFTTYFKNEDLGFSYAQIGQENGFSDEFVAENLKNQIDILLKHYPDVQFKKMSDTGKLFKEKYDCVTPATCVWANTDWNTGEDIQSLYYDCKNYSVNLFRCENRVFIRSLYLFDDKIKEYYYDTPCTTWDALYENLPVADTLLWQNNTGLGLSENGKKVTVEKVSDSSIKATWGENDKKVIFDEDKITIKTTDEITFDISNASADINVLNNRIEYNYKGNIYGIVVNGAKISVKNDFVCFQPISGEIILSFVRR